MSEKGYAALFLRYGIKIAKNILLWIVYFFIANTAAALIVLSIQSVDIALYYTAFLCVAIVYLIYHLICRRLLHSRIETISVLLIGLGIDILYTIVFFIQPDYYLKRYLLTWVWGLRVIFACINLGKPR